MKGASRWLEANVDSGRLATPSSAILPRYFRFIRVSPERLLPGIHTRSLQIWMQKFAAARSRCPRRHRRQAQGASACQVGPYMALGPDGARESAEAAARVRASRCSTRAALRRSLPLEEVLEVQAQCPGYARMHDKIGRGEGFVLEPRCVVVLDVVPFHVEQIEDIGGEQPFARPLVAELQINGRVGRGPGAVVFDQRRFAKMPGLERSKPARGMIGSEAGIDDVGRTVGNVTSRDGNGLCAGMAGAAAPQPRSSGGTLASKRPLENAASRFARSQLLMRTLLPTPRRFSWLRHSGR